MSIGRTFRAFAAAATLAAGLGEAALAAASTDRSAPAETKSSRLRDAGSKTGEIMSQPARDVGISKSEIPPVLVSASAAPYSLQGLRTCRQISEAVRSLNEVLGEDFKGGPEEKENRAGKLAEAGGRTVINSLIPYRSLVREISGAAPAQRRLNAALDAGYARRGFLRGVHQTRKCRTPF